LPPVDDDDEPTMILPDLEGKPGDDDERTMMLTDLGDVVADLKRLTPPLEGQSFELRPGVHTVGTKHADIVLDRKHAKAVSRLHAKIEVVKLLKQYDYFVTDLGSSNGTFHDGERVHGRVQVRHGAVLRFGNVEMQLSSREPNDDRTIILGDVPSIPSFSQNSTKQLDELAANPVIAHFVRLTPPHEDDTFDLRAGATTMGTEQTDITLDPKSDLTVSRRHARVEIECYRQNYDVRVTDFGSTNGTFIENRRLDKNERAELREGDTLRLGNVEFRFFLGESPPRRKRARPAPRRRDRSDHSDRPRPSY
ncbi:MAG: FHA domain-containing protein, partial [Planctomycetota bacterium]